MALARAEADREIVEGRRARDRARKAIPRNSAEGVEIQETPSPLNPPLKDPQTPKITPPISPHPVARASRLPDDFTVPGDWIQWAVKKRGWDRDEAADEAECFCRFWQSKSGRDAVKLDWLKTWQNWAVNSRRRSNGSGMQMPC